MSRTRTVFRESWIIGRTHDGNYARVVIQPLNGYGFALRWKHTGMYRGRRHKVSQVFDKGDYSRRGMRTSS
jgi:hypothetical protein